MHAQDKQAAERKANEVGAIGVDQVDTDCGVGYVRCEFDKSLSFMTSTYYFCNADV